MNKTRTRCIACHRLTDRVDAACPACEQEVEENLVLLGGPHGLYATVIGLGPGVLHPVAAGRVERASNRTEVSLPINSASIDLTSATGGVVTTLRRWVVVWHSGRDFQDPQWPPNLLSVNTGVELIRGQLDVAIDALLASLSWAAECRSDFRDFRNDVERMVVMCRRLIDPTDPDTKPIPRIYLGRCPGPDDSDDGCGERLEVKVGSTNIRCTTCTTIWPMRRWPYLASRVNR